MMDNAGQIVGGQIVMNRKSIEPADGKWELSGLKAWFVKGDMDVNKAFAVHEIPAHQAEYAAIIKMGMEFLDQETAIPTLAEGNQGQATDVLGGMNLLLNASNVVQRRALKALDDQVTIPHISRYVDWNMQYNSKSSIKGDFEVQARASGALMERDIQNKGAANLLALSKDPAFAHGMKKWDALRRVIQALRFNPKDFVLEDDEIIEAEKNLKPPVDPRVEVQQMKVIAEAKLEKARQDYEGYQNELDRQNNLAVAVIDERMKSTELTSEERQTLANIKAEFTKTAAQLKTQRDLSLANLKLDLHKHSNPQILTPPTEPAGRAKNGEAFQA